MGRPAQPVPFTITQLLRAVLVAASLAGCASPAPSSLERPTDMSSPHRAATRDEPIPLDTPDPKYQYYFTEIRQRIQRTWIYPQEAPSQRIAGDVEIDFRIAKTGVLQSIERRRSSGFELLDAAAMRAVREASPFPAVPDEISKGSLPIRGVFRYRLRTLSGGSNDLCSSRGGAWPDCERR